MVARGSFSTLIDRVGDCCGAALPRKRSRWGEDWWKSCTMSEPESPTAGSGCLVRDDDLAVKVFVKATPPRIRIIGDAMVAFKPETLLRVNRWCGALFTA